MSEKVIALFNEDIKGEHMAIVQYLRHAYALGEGAMACEIEAIAREEMRHLDWLSEKIVELGGKPTLERAEIDLGGTAPGEWLRRDVKAEEDAIIMYKEHIEAIDDPEMKRLLRRILSDEEAHRAAFSHMVEKLERGKIAPEGTLLAEKRDKTIDMLNWGIRHEYTVILQYLYHSYLTPDEEVSLELQDQAINETQHLGWLAEGMTETGGSPEIEETGVDRSEETVDMLQADVAVEREVTKEYTRQIKEVEDPGLKRLLTRIRDHEIYHDQLFTDLLEGLEKE
ncbi:MAG: ferritin-like domain-containing protein [Anaerolineae bacterium]|nr:ferritin-like domain-containing protein [Anaerolineae bacterium]